MLKAGIEPHNAVADVHQLFKFWRPFLRKASVRRKPLSLSGTPAPTSRLSDQQDDVLYCLVSRLHQDLSACIQTLLILFRLAVVTWNSRCPESEQR